MNENRKKPEARNSFEQSSRQKAGTPGAESVPKTADDINNEQIQEARGTDTEYQGKPFADGREVRGAIRTIDENGVFKKEVVSSDERGPSEPASGNEEQAEPPAPPEVINDQH